MTHKMTHVLGTIIALFGLSACEITINPEPQSPPQSEVPTQTPPADTATRSGSIDDISQTPNGTGNGGQTPKATTANPPSPPQVTANAPTQFETRCGWFSNPTPGNISLHDADREWVIGMQGGHQVATDWDWPNFAQDQWMVTNVGSYGYGCACMDVRANPATGTISDIRNVRAQALAICQQDPALNQWASLFP